MFLKSLVNFLGTPRKFFAILLSNLSSNLSQQNKFFAQFLAVINNHMQRSPKVGPQVGANADSTLHIRKVRPRVGPESKSKPQGEGYQIVSKMLFVKLQVGNCGAAN